MNEDGKDEQDSQNISANNTSEKMSDPLPLPLRTSSSCKKIRRDIVSLLDNIKNDIYNNRDRHALSKLKDMLEEASKDLQKGMEKAFSVAARTISNQFSRGQIFIK